MPVFKFMTSASKTFITLSAESYTSQIDDKCYLNIVWSTAFGTDAYIQVGTPLLETNIVTLDQTNMKITIEEYHDSPATKRKEKTNGLTEIEFILIILGAAILILLIVALICNRKRRTGNTL